MASCPHRAAGTARQAPSKAQVCRGAEVQCCLLREPVACGWGWCSLAVGAVEAAGSAAAPAVLVSAAEEGFHFHGCISLVSFSNTHIKVP